MASPPPAAELMAQVDQVARYEFRATFPGTSFPAIVLDEGAPVGSGHGPDPVRMLSAAVAHCMSSTLVNTLERSHVAVTPIQTRVRATVGPNARGRRRVLRLDVEIAMAPLHEEDRGRFEHGVAIFEDFCTVSGAVREGVPIATVTEPPRATPTGGP